MTVKVISTLTNLTKQTSDRHLGKLTFILIVFVLAFVLMCFAIGKLIPESNIPVVSTKLRSFSVYKNHYNTIFIGSSRMYRHVVPDTFDRTMRSYGYPIQSFNFGVYGMHVPETYFLLKKILAMKPENLKWIFVELYDLQLNIPKANIRTDRVIYWHTLQHTLWIYNLILASDDHMFRKLNHFRDHTQPLLYNVINLGKADSLINYIFPEAKSITHKSISSEDIVFRPPGIDGYLSLEDEYDDYFQHRHDEYLRGLNHYIETVDTLTQKSQQTTHLKSYELNIIDQFIKIIQDSKATPIFVITPLLEKQDHFIAAYQKGHIPTLFAFNDPVAFPDLYSPKSRFDQAHLNEQGAQKFTMSLAQKFAEYMRKDKT
jgi:hypothetical protein